MYFFSTLSNAYVNLQVILQKNTRVREKVSPIFVYVLGLLYSSGFLNVVLSVYFAMVVLSSELWDKRLDSEVSRLKCCFQCNWWEEKMRGLLLFQNDATIMSCTDSVIWDSTIKHQESFDKSFFVRKCHFIAAFKHWNVSSPKFGKITSPDDICRKGEIKLRERTWLSPRCVKPTLQPQSS